MNYYERIQESINYIEENLLDALSLDESAKKAYMSLAVYYRIFFSIVGYTPKEYIRRRRINEAAERLSHKDSKVIEVALSCGYQSVDAFSRAFRAVTGLLPLKFRKENQKFVFERMNKSDRIHERCGIHRRLRIPNFFDRNIDVLTFFGIGNIFQVFIQLSYLRNAVIII